MRIITGKLGGLNFDAPKGHRTHPMSEKMRGALFSALGDIEGLTVLDAFAGSGALGLEAISRGADSVVAIDNDTKACQTIVLNAKKLRAQDKLKVTKANISGWSDKNEDKKFDLVFAAPPYDNLQIGSVLKTARHVNNDGLFVLDWPYSADTPILEPLEVKVRKTHGDASLIFYKNVTI